MLRHHYPSIPFGRLVMKRHHYPPIPCAPCSGKLRIDLVFTVHFNCKYFTSLYFIYVRTRRTTPRDFACRQNPCGGNKLHEPLQLNSVLCFRLASNGWQGGRVAEWLGCWTSSPWVPGSNPTLSTSWICFSVVPSYKSFGCACI